MLEYISVKLPNFDRKYEKLNYYTLMQVFSLTELSDEDLDMLHLIQSGRKEKGKILNEKHR